MSEMYPESDGAEEAVVIEGQEAILVDAPAEAEPVEEVGDAADADASDMDALAVPSADEPDHDAGAVEVETAAEDGE